MTAMKKSSAKPAAKSPAPATKAASPAKAAPAAKAPAAPKAAAKAPVPAKPAAAKTAPKKKVAVAAPAPEPTPAPVAAPAPAVKPVETKPVVTTISAQIDIGFGNALYLRGEGAGLSWDQGLLMKCVSDDVWQITVGESAHPIVFKFLVNDLSWSTGEDYSVAPGSSVTLVPSF